MPLDVCVYQLEGVLQRDVSLILNRTGRILTQMFDGTLRAQCVLSEQEMRTLGALLEASPQPCSYFTLYAAITEIPIERVEIFFEQVHEEAQSVMAEAARPVLRRCRAVLDPFELGIRHIEGEGYQVVRL